MTELQQTIITLVNEIPHGMIISYGAIAKEVLKRTKRMVTAQLIGRQLSGMHEHERNQLPWWRVVNKQAYVSSLKLWVKGLKQISLLEKEWYTIINWYIQDPERFVF
jgi:alkylated DNA nucleotide flippase Atl1